jgi:cytidyltransferase-like protein
VTVGVAHGRFQPFHIGHLEYVLAAWAQCDTLVVGITNADPWTVRHEATNPSRGLAAHNPWTYYERMLMVDACLRVSTTHDTPYYIVPFPHSYPERLRFYSPPDAVHFLTIYDEWGEEKLRRLSGMGLRTQVLWRRVEPVTSGTEIRRLIAAEKTWVHLVPPPVADVIARIGTGSALDRPSRTSA